MRKMTERQFTILRDLDDERWMRPMDVGGRDASHHSATMAQLVRKGLAERRTRGSDRSFEYRRTPAGYTAVHGSRPSVRTRMDRWPGSIG